MILLIAKFWPTFMAKFPAIVSIMILFPATVEEQLFSGSMEGSSASSVKPMVSQDDDKMMTIL